MLTDVADDWGELREYQERSRRIEQQYLKVGAPTTAASRRAQGKGGRVTDSDLPRDVPYAGSRSHCGGGGPTRHSRTSAVLPGQVTPDRLCSGAAAPPAVAAPSDKVGCSACQGGSHKRGQRAGKQGRGGLWGADAG